MDRIIRARGLHFPGATDDSMVFHEDAVLCVKDGKIVEFDQAEKLQAQGLDLSQCEHHPNQVLMPGFIDPHIHFPQLDVVASYGTRLLEWLETYTFPAERRFSDQHFAVTAADEFCNALLAAGTTTAMAYPSSHPTSVEALFQAARARHMRLLTGKVLMDQNAPDGVRDAMPEAIRESERLLMTWHGVDRLGYVITPRFAGTSTPEQLEAAGELFSRYPETWVQTHLSETVEEIAWTAEIHPHAKHYFDIYEQVGLIGPRAMMGHCIHLSDEEINRMSETGTAAVFCPSSNLFLGSGLMPLDRLETAEIPVGLASDVGGGPQMCLLHTMADAYRVLQLQQRPLSAREAFFRITKGNARVLQLEGEIGDFRIGSAADFVLLDPTRSPEVERRVAISQTIDEALFAMMILGDARLILETSVLGEPLYQAGALEASEFEASNG